MKKFLSTKYNETTWSIALLLLRAGFGYSMLLHGLQKMQKYGDGVEGDVKMMSTLFGSPMDGILVIFAELFCSILLILGLFTRFASIALLITMCVAFFKVHHGSLKEGESAFGFLIVYAALTLTGPGKFSIDRMIAK